MAPFIKITEAKFWKSDNKLGASEIWNVKSYLEKDTTEKSMTNPSCAEETRDPSNWKLYVLHFKATLEKFVNFKTM